MNRFLVPLLTLTLIVAGSANAEHINDPLLPGARPVGPAQTLRLTMEAFERQLGLFSTDLNNIQEGYPAEVFQPGVHSLFKREMGKLKRDYMSAEQQFSLVSLLARMKELSVQCVNLPSGPNPGGGVPGQPCPTSTRCGSCAFPGKRTCTVLDCHGKTVNSYEENCSLDPKLYSCTKCTFVAGDGVLRSRNVYDVYYNGIKVTRVGDSPILEAYDSCYRAWQSDSRCQ